MGVFLRVMSATTALVLGSTATATKPPTEQDILVTGQLPSREAVTKEARQYVKQVSARPVSGQFARWRSPICPKTTGISLANAELVNTTIRQIALDAGARVSRANCKANVTVIFTDNSDRDTAFLLKNKHRVFGKLNRNERELLSQPRLPVRWWYETAIEGSDGHQLTSSPAMFLTAVIEGQGSDVSASAGMVSNGDTVGVDGYSSSLVGTRIRAKIARATLIVDVNAAAGAKLKSVAAYAAMVTLARIRMGGGFETTDSILGQFGEGDLRRDDLSKRDKAFLSALYSVPPNRDARQQENQIAIAMSRILASE
jgi:hypothetical protein